MLEPIPFPVAFVAVRAEAQPENSRAELLRLSTHCEVGEFRCGCAVTCARGENVEYPVIPVITGGSGSTVPIPTQLTLGDTLFIKNERHRARENKFL